MVESFNEKIVTALKWSSIAEIFAKLFIPITNIVLARILTPEAFGVIAIVTMIVSLAEILSDSGFQKYIVQYEFNSEKNKTNYFNVAFWTNIIISISLWILTVLFSDIIAVWVGNPGLGKVIIIAGISLPLTSISNIQMAIYRRNLDFKTLFYVRIAGAFIPMIVTIPFALLGFSYWALIIGNISGNILNAVLLSLKSYWKPSFYYDFAKLKEMLSYSIWSLVDSVLSWLTYNIGTIIVGGILSEYYLGLYKTTIITVNGILSIITASTTSVLFSSLSRVQNNDKEFKEIYMNFMKVVALIMLPMGVGIYVFRDLFTWILLGSQWNETIPFLGIYGLTSSISLVYAIYCYEIYRSRGNLKIAVAVQIIHLIFLIPILIISTNISFIALSYSTSFIKLGQILVNSCFMYVIIKISPLEMLKNTWESLVGAVAMGVVALLLKNIVSGIWWSMFSIGICVAFYYCIIYFMPDGRKLLYSIARYINVPGKSKILYILKRDQMV
jgi:Membrane protein involved in the export of O-antigen and teichoic acid